MTVFSLLIPCIFISILVYSFIKKVNIYDGFVKGASGAIPLIIDIFPYLAAIFLLTEMLEVSGISAKICDFSEPIFSFFGIPKEIIKLILIKPFSGSGATALLDNILSTCPPDGYIARCATVCYGSSETIFYISAVYFAKCKKTKLSGAIAISLTASFASAIFACFLCKFI